MGRHVIASFKGMTKVWLIFGYYVVEYAFHVCAYVRVSIFVYAKSAACMFNK